VIDETYGQAFRASKERAVASIMPSYTVVYDGDCKVCQRSVAALAKWDRLGTLEIIPSQAPGVAEKFPWIAPSAFEESVQVIRVADNKTWQGGAAVEELMSALPRGTFFSWIFSIPFARPIAERLYRWFAGNRHRFGCKDHCGVR
jgi:predicted DCC family thiol-disulfide oxidoreductase YuxK